MQDQSSGPNELNDSQPSSQRRKLSVFLMRVFATVDFDNSGRTLKKFLTVYHLIFLGIACAIGSGAYSIIGVAAQSAGPSIIFSFIIVGVMCFFTCFPYAEFAAKIQSAGFSYSYIYATCGELLGYLTGHALHLINIASSAICARCCAAYLASFLGQYGVHIPEFFYNWEVCGMKVCIFGALIIVGLAVLMLCGMKDSTTVNNIVSIMNLATLVFAIIAGLFYMEPSKYYSNFFTFGAKGIFSGMGLTFYTFLGFEALTCFTEEAVKPEKDIPTSLVVVLIVSIFINGGIAAVMTGMAPLAVMDNSKSLLAVFQYRCPQWMSVIIFLGSLSGLVASAFANLLCQPRIFYAMAYDRLLPKAFMRTNPKTQVPDFSIVAAGAICAAITLLFDVDLAGNAVSLVGLLVSSTVDLSVVVARYDLDCTFSRQVNRGCFIFFLFSLLTGASFYYGWPILVTILFATPLVLVYLYTARQTQVNIPKNFACPCVPLIPMLGALTFLLMASTVDLKAWAIVLTYLGIGGISYFMYGYWQSKLNPYRRESAASVTQADLPEGVLTELAGHLNDQPMEAKKLTEGDKPDAKAP